MGQQLQAAVLRAYQQMEHEGKDQCRVSYLADRAAFQVQTKSVAEGTVIGYADMQAGQDLKVHQIRIRRGSDGRLSCMYPAQASGSNENKQWHNLAAELSDGRLHEEILKVFRQEHPRGLVRSFLQHNIMSNRNGRNRKKRKTGSDKKRVRFGHKRKDEVWKKNPDKKQIESGCWVC